ncbi:hypothetical protein [Cohnella silvisoli]|uniref:Uncharacterized protein n=1 Tax=Cohnella silvisoli TaxID=2873699 RepID=A0ABV1L6N2_9BACL|nr:hypothetical protein [Cohnella silvisoli]MCD9026572.1 hypothetical protein [Cohnella silvisoli]
MRGQRLDYRQEREVEVFEQSNWEKVFLLNNKTFIGFERFFFPFAALAFLFALPFLAFPFFI